MNQSIIKAFDILAFVVENPRKMSLSQMSAALKMNKTTLFRFLSTLEAIDIVSKDGDVYVPGMRLFQLGSRVPVKQLLVDKVLPLMRRLTDEVNETVNMGELRGQQVLYLTKSESKRSLQIKTRVGGYTSLHSTGLGKSILSIVPDHLRESLIANLDFVKNTENTILDVETLRKHIVITQERGYSTDLEELEEGLHCVAVPLLIEELNFYGAISCSGPTARFTHEYIAELAGKLQETARDIKKLFIKGENA